MLNTITDAIETVTDGPIQPGTTVAHKRFRGTDDKGQPYGVTEHRPACLPAPAEPERDRWSQRGAGRAIELGAVLCSAPECFGGAR